MAPQELQPGKKVSIIGQMLDDQRPKTLIVEKFPVRGLYHDYALCRCGDLPLYFLPAELRPAEESIAAV